MREDMVADRKVRFSRMRSVHARGMKLYSYGVQHAYVAERYSEQYKCMHAYKAYKS